MFYVAPSRLSAVTQRSKKTKHAFCTLHRHCSHRSRLLRPSKSELHYSIQTNAYQWTTCQDNPVITVTSIDVTPIVAKPGQNVTSLIRGTTSMVLCTKTNPHRPSRNSWWPHCRCFPKGSSSIPIQIRYLQTRKAMPTRSRRLRSNSCSKRTIFCIPRNIHCTSNNNHILTIIDQESSNIKHWCETFLCFIWLWRQEVNWTLHINKSVHTKSLSSSLDMFTAFSFMCVHFLWLEINIYCYNMFPSPVSTCFRCLVILVVLTGLKLVQQAKHH